MAAARGAWGRPAVEKAPYVVAVASCRGSQQRAWKATKRRGGRARAGHGPRGTHCPRRGTEQQYYGYSPTTRLVKLIKSPEQSYSIPSVQYNNENINKSNNFEFNQNLWKIISAFLYFNRFVIKLHSIINS